MRRLRLRGVVVAIMIRGMMRWTMTTECHIKKHTVPNTHIHAAAAAYNTCTQGRIPCKQAPAKHKPDYLSRLSAYSLLPPNAPSRHHHHHRVSIFVPFVSPTSQEVRLAILMFVSCSPNSQLTRSLTHPRTSLLAGLSTRGRAIEESSGIFLKLAVLGS